MSAIAAAFVAACEAELRALKPGNVHVFAPGHGMTVEDFRDSARVSAPEIARTGAPIGARIEAAIAATQRAVATNTNLGIALLAAPLAAAAEAAPTPLREALATRLAALDLADAEAAFRAIAMAAPAGLGAAPEHDVRARPRVSLRAAMAAAASRDLIAREYARGFAITFEETLPDLREGIARWGALEPAASLAYLRNLNRRPDSHIARKSGRAAAEAVMAAAAAPLASLETASDPAAAGPALLAFDADLKAAGRNPGTMADLTVAGLFAHLLEAP